MTAPTGEAAPTDTAAPGTGEPIRSNPPVVVHR